MFDLSFALEIGKTKNYVNMQVINSAIYQLEVDQKSIESRWGNVKLTWP